MKNQSISTEPNQVSQTESTLIKPLSFSNSLPDFTLNCSGSHPSTQICINKNCKQTLPFVCSDMDCQCQVSHEQCVKGNLKFITKKLSHKINTSQTIKSEIEAQFDQMIDSLSDLRDKILTEIDFKFKYANLHNLEYTFLKALQSQEFPSSLIGETQNFWKLLTENTTQKANSFEILVQKVNELSTIIQEKQGKISSFINSHIQKLSREQVFFEDSSLGLYEMQNCENLLKMFNKKIKTSKLLFKASEKQFQMSKFYQLCGLETNLLIVCRTNKQKLIGGYTPLSFKGRQLDIYIEDPSRETFIFSLTHNDKFTMKNNNNAIYRVLGQERICFGGCEFEICNHADKVKKCRSYSLNYYFQNGNYQSNKKESFERFNGNQDEYFTVQEWEAWKITFDEEV